MVIKVEDRLPIEAPTAKPAPGFEYAVIAGIVAVIAFAALWLLGVPVKALSCVGVWVVAVALILLWGAQERPGRERLKPCGSLM